jgi:hypothetical protein
MHTLNYQHFVSLIVSEKVHFAAFQTRCTQTGGKLGESTEPHQTSSFPFIVNVYSVIIVSF